MSINSDDVFDIIEEIAADPSKNNKQALVAQYAEHELFKQVLVYALNPFMKFNIRPDRPRDTSNFTLGGARFDTLTWQLLDRLNDRNLTGNAAREEIDAEFSRLTPSSADLLWRIIRKDLRAHFSESTVNKAIKGLIPDPPYMRCCLPKDAKLDKFSWVEGVYSQEKADGMFANVDHELDGTVRITSRNGSEFPIDQFSNIVLSVQKRITAGTQQHGELLVEKAGVILARELGNGILNSIQQGGTFEVDEHPIYVAWDQIPLSAVVPKGKHTTPYKTRFAGLQSPIGTDPTKNLHVVETRIVHSMLEAYKHYGEMLSRGKEGTVIKDGEAPWRDGTSKQQVKLKLTADCDLIIKGFTEGNGKNKGTFGSIIGETSDGLLAVGVSGFSDKLRQEISDSREDLLGTIMAVQFNDIMYPSADNKLHSLFLPRYLEFRADKTTADSLQRVIEQMEAAKQAHIS